YDQGPYRLDPGPHLFFDWRYVFPGQVRWLTPQGQQAPLSGEGLAGKVQVHEVRANPSQVPYGLRLEAPPAGKIGPVVRKDKPWERNLGAYVSLHFLDGKYRLWYDTKPPSGGPDLLCYAESSDGIAWEKPSLGLVEFQGNKANNIVFGGPL